MAQVPLSVVVDDAHRDKLDEVSERLQTAGMKVEQTLKSLGTINGSVDAEQVEHLSSVRGVKAVLKGRKVHTQNRP